MGLYEQRNALNIYLVFSFTSKSTELSHFPFNQLAQVLAFLMSPSLPWQTHRIQNHSSAIPFTRQFCWPFSHFQIRGKDTSSAARCRHWWHSESTWSTVVGNGVLSMATGNHLSRELWIIRRNYGSVFSKHDTQLSDLTLWTHANVLRSFSNRCLCQINSSSLHTKVRLLTLSVYFHVIGQDEASLSNVSSEFDSLTTHEHRASSPSDSFIFLNTTQLNSPSKWTRRIWRPMDLEHDQSLLWLTSFPFDASLPTEGCMSNRCSLNGCLMWPCREAHLAMLNSLVSAAVCQKNPPPR